MVTVSSNQNLEQLRSLRPDIVIGDLTERTHRGTIVWNRLPGQMYEAIDEEYDFKLFNNGNQIVLDFFKNGVLRLTMLSSVYPSLNGLYKDVGIFTRLPGENQVRKLLRGLLSGENIRVLPPPPIPEPIGGVVVGGSSTGYASKPSHGGCVIGGTSPVDRFISSQGGWLVGGSCIIQMTHTPPISGGVVAGGQAYSQGDLIFVSHIFNQIVGMAAHPTKNVIYIASETSIGMFTKDGTLLSVYTINGNFVTSITPYGLALDAPNNRIFISLQNNVYCYNLDPSTGLITTFLDFAYQQPNPFSISGSGSLATNGPVYLATTDATGVNGIVLRFNFDGSGLTQANGVLNWRAEMFVRNGQPWVNPPKNTPPVDFEYTDFTTRFTLAAQFNVGFSACYDSGNDLIYYCGFDGSNYFVYRMLGTGGPATKVNNGVGNFTEIVMAFDPVFNNVYITQGNAVYRIQM